MSLWHPKSWRKHLSESSMWYLYLQTTATRSSNSAFLSRGSRLSKMGGTNHGYDVPFPSFKDYLSMSKKVDRPLQFEPLRKPYMRQFQQTFTDLRITKPYHVPIWTTTHSWIEPTATKKNNIDRCEVSKKTTVLQRLFSGPIPKPCLSLSFLLGGLSPMNSKHGKKKLLRWLIMLFFKKTCPNHVQHSACNHNDDDEAICNMTLKFMCHDHFNHNFTALESPERPGQTCL